MVENIGVFRHLVLPQLRLPPSHAKVRNLKSTVWKKGSSVHLQLGFYCLLLRCLCLQPVEVSLLAAC